MIKLKCKRCGSIYPAPVDDWVTCGRCGLSLFAGVKEPVADVKAEGEDVKPEVGKDVEPEAEEVVEE